MVWPLAIPLIQAGASLATSALNNSAQSSANAKNVRLQREQQAWEERLSNTAIQRRAADIRRAGGNPALAFTNGSEASTPTVAPAKVEPSRYDAIDVTSGLMVKKQLEKMDAEIGLTHEQEHVARASASNLEQQTVTGVNTAANLAQQTSNLKAEQDKLVAQLKGILTDNELKALELKLKNATLDKQIEIVNEQLRSAKLGNVSNAQKAKVAEAKGGFMDYMRDRLDELKKPFHFWPNGQAPTPFKRNSGKGKFQPQRKGR